MARRQGSKRWQLLALLGSNGVVCERNAAERPQWRPRLCAEGCGHAGLSSARGRATTGHCCCRTSTCILWCAAQMKVRQVVTRTTLTHGSPDCTHVLLLMRVVTVACRPHAHTCARCTHMHRHHKPGQPAVTRIPLCTHPMSHCACLWRSRARHSFTSAAARQTPSSGFCHRRCGTSPGSRRRRRLAGP